MAWALTSLSGDPADLHDRVPDEPVVRQAWLLDVDRPAMVLGSTQSDLVLSEPRLRDAGVEVVRRHSGGGAVLLWPGTTLWVDVIIPPDDPLFDSDVTRSFFWLGDLWAKALAESGCDPEVRVGGPLWDRLGRLICFAGLGPGEVSLGGRKVVGISQRRGRWGCRFQCVAYSRWDPQQLVSLFDSTALGMPAAVAAAELERRAAAVPGSLEDLASRFGSLLLATRG